MNRKELDKKFDELLEENLGMVDAVFAVACALRGLWPESKDSEPEDLKIGDQRNIFCQKCGEKTGHTLIIKNNKWIWECVVCNSLTSLGLEIVE